MLSVYQDQKVRRRLQNNITYNCKKVMKSKMKSQLNVLIIEVTVKSNGRSWVENSEG